MSAALSSPHKPEIAIKTYYSPEFICQLQDVAKRIPQLKKTGDNFSIWEKRLKIMIRNLTGSSDYLLHEFHKHDPKLNQAVFDLIMWSIDDELLEHCNMDGSAGDAFQVLAGRFQSKPSARCIINRADFPEEILDNIVNMVYYQSAQEHISITKRKSERVSHFPLMKKAYMKLHVYLGHSGPPVLNSIQNLAVVNRKFYRLCLPKLWQKVAFPTSLPAPMSLWTGNLLLKHGNLVKSAEFDLEDVNAYQDAYQDGHQEVCPALESVSLSLPPSEPQSEWLSTLRFRLKSAFKLLPSLQHLDLSNEGYVGRSGDFIIDIIKKTPSLTSLVLTDFKFAAKESEEESLGWNLAQLQKLRKLELHSITCEDQTWTSETWTKPLTNLELDCCEGLTPDMMHRLLSGRTPFLTELNIEFHELGEDDVNIRFDLPALKTLILYLYEIPDLLLLVSFVNCKSIEVLKYNGDIYDTQWDSMKNLISQHAWPKLSVLDLHRATFHDGYARPMTAEEMEKEFKMFNIKVLMQKCRK
ncbi:uncharacterized protein MELLADRAFT_116038 [Melampsora larici-populina 98AG31]|uniref:F-box domain-containing protein n=1 Tax=Melampsora larici-populina (strain 98AG31 / pathotype 3-4-7) TaxID=747676 RepID=F4RH55_MELLP|nr:uncharacterized protein MELLADRAFT_116038 [Melampsora larici-populina 98AG31]EGG08391.1 hypothetical protein MELLADRAFT_116038 [Melampsora larici-populina 98AG31]